MVRKDWCIHEIEFADCTECRHTVSDGGSGRGGNLYQEDSHIFDGITITAYQRDAWIAIGQMLVIEGQE
jgi:hypothetical protein